MTQLDLFSPLDLTQFFRDLASCTDKLVLTHSLHPYPAKFIPHIPRALIRNYAEPGAHVLDPMCGSGTTLVEAAVAGYQATGIDLNPVAVLVSRAKTTSLEPSDRDELRSLIAELRHAGEELRRFPEGLQNLVRESELPVFKNRRLWFDDSVVRELAHIKSRIESLSSHRARVVAFCAFSAMIVPLSNQESETRWCSKPKRVAPGEPALRVADRLEYAVERVGQFQALRPASVQVHEGDARATHLPDGSVNLIVTSPPYANSHDYYLYNKLRLFWFDRDVAPIQKSEIGSRNRHSDQREGIDIYLAEMTAVFLETARVLAHEGVAVFVVGDAVIRGALHKMDELLPGQAESCGLSLQDHFAFPHKGFNASFQPEFGTRLSKQTHVLVFAKDAVRRRDS